jgi:hypothetical protein
LNARSGPPIAWLFLLGATLGTAMDILHVQSGVERYPAPVLFGVAWWVPPLFGAATVSIGYSHILADRLLRHRRIRSPLLSGAGELLWLVLAYLLSASGLETLAKVGLLLVIYLNFWVMVGGGWQNLLLALVTAITGTLIEMIEVASGAFAYLHPDFLGVPYWLPCIYACASLAVGDFGRALMLASRRENEARRLPRGA